MDELKESSIHHTSIHITSELKSMKVYESLYTLVQKLVCTADVDKDDIKNTLESVMRDKGIETEIRNIVFHLVRNSIKSEIKASLQSVCRYRGA